MPNCDRRHFLAAAGLSVTGLLTTPTRGESAEFTLPPLPYPVDALEPYIDAKTMEIHHDRHHKAYVDNLNKAVAGTPWADKPIEEILKNIESVPEDIRTAVINNGGGHYNHTMFWQIMAKPSGSAKVPEELLKAWGSDADSLKKAVKDAGLARFGSGWSWVVWVPKEKKLSVASTANQDCPLMFGWFPILGLDVWEHAYYLKYLNKRADYIDAWWNVVNWDAVQARLKIAMKM
jgi:Fe-Mn family superoxide dismutase